MGMVELADSSDAALLDPLFPPCVEVRIQCLKELLVRHPVSGHSGFERERTIMSTIINEHCLFITEFKIFA